MNENNNNNNNGGNEKKNRDNNNLRLMFSLFQKIKKYPSEDGY